jgi:hypothetical protein
MENSSIGDVTVSLNVEKLGSDSDGTPANESPLSQKLAIASSGELQSVHEVVAHAPLQSGFPITFDVVEPVKDDRDVTMSRTCCPAVKRDERSVQFPCRWCPTWQTGPRRRRYDAAQGREVLTGFPDCAETLYEKRDRDRLDCNLRAIDRQLKGTSVATHNHVLATVDVHEDVLKTWQAWED